MWKLVFASLLTWLTVAARKPQPIHIPSMVTSGVPIYNLDTMQASSASDGNNTWIVVAKPAESDVFVSAMCDGGSSALQCESRGDPGTGGIGFVTIRASLKDLEAYAAVHHNSMAFIEPDMPVYALTAAPGEMNTYLDEAQALEQESAVLGKRSGYWVLVASTAGVNGCGPYGSYNEADQQFNKYVQSSAACLSEAGRFHCQRDHNGNNYKAAFKKKFDECKSNPSSCTSCTGGGGGSPSPSPAPRRRRSGGPDPSPSPAPVEVRRRRSGDGGGGGWSEAPPRGPWEGSVPPDKEIWNLDRIDASEGMDGSFTRRGGFDGTGVHVYVLDTGIKTTHQEFGGRAIPTLESLSGRPTICKGQGDTNCALDRAGHGSHCAGSVGGNTMGVAPGATIHAVKVLNDQGSGYTAPIVAAISWVLQNAIRPAVISMSLGGSKQGVAYELAIDKAVEGGITVVVAAGNNNGNACSKSPAYVPSAITVGSTNITDERSYFSNYGECIDIWAPGHNIMSVGVKDNSALYVDHGTSMACPLVSGAVALYLQENGKLSPAEIMRKLEADGTKDAITDVKQGSPNLFLRIQPEEKKPPPQEESPRQRGTRRRRRSEARRRTPRRRNEARRRTPRRRSEPRRRTPRRRSEARRRTPRRRSGARRRTPRRRSEARRRTPRRRTPTPTTTPEPEARRRTPRRRTPTPTTTPEPEARRRTPRRRAPPPTTTTPVPDDVLPPQRRRNERRRRDDHSPDRRRRRDESSVLSSVDN